MGLWDSIFGKKPEKKKVKNQSLISYGGSVGNSYYDWTNHSSFRAESHSGNHNHNHNHDHDSGSNGNGCDSGCD